MRSIAKIFSIGKKVSGKSLKTYTKHYGRKISDFQALKMRSLAAFWAGLVSEFEAK